MVARIVEAGHYYSAHGPTKWAEVGWRILLETRREEDASLLLIDNLHPIGDVSEHERRLPVESGYESRADYVIMEADLIFRGEDALSVLKTLHKRKRARQKSGAWFCSGFPITNQRGEPTCVLLDAALTVLKHDLGFNHAVNILPYYYEEEQRDLLRLVAKLLPGFRLDVILFDIDGRSWEMR